MSHSKVYKWFELYFPQYAGDKVPIRAAGCFAVLATVPY